MPARPPSTTDLLIRNEIAQLAILREAMERIGMEHGLAKKPLYQLLVALDEVVSNVIKYAWPEGGAHEIRVRITVDSARVTIEVVDDGKPFDPLNAPPVRPAPPGRRPRPGGVGIYMLKQFMDKIEHARIDGWNHLTLIKRCDVATQDQ